MTKFKAISLILFLAIGLLSFKSSEPDPIEFSYPKRANTTIQLMAPDFKKFKKEWRGQDYYYISTSKNGIICSVLYYKLNDEELVLLVDTPKKLLGAPDISPVYPFTHFTTNSNLRDYETNNADWGQPTDDFMFRQNDIIEFAGVKIRQKNMYGYSMLSKDLFVKVHLSKTECTPADSAAMRHILGSLARK